MNNPEPTDMNGTLITDLVDMVQKRMGIDLELLGASPSRNNPRRYGRIPLQSRTPPRHAINPAHNAIDLQYAAN